MSQSSLSFTEGRIFSPLVRFTLPVLGASLLQTMYGAVDLMVVGQFASSADVSAVNTGSWIMMLITSAVIGISMGSTVIIGRHLGAGEKEEAGHTIGASIWLFGIITVIMTLIALLLAPLIVRVMKVPNESVVPCLSYIRICGVGLIFIIAFNILGSIFRGIGDSKIPFLSVAFACIFNIAGDLLLTGLLKMATVGAAIATVAAQAVSVLLSLLIIRKKTMPFTFGRAQMAFDPHRMGIIFRLGVPLAFQDVLVSISFLMITAIVNSLGVIISAGVGVAERLCGFIMLVPSAFSQALAAFTAQNIGAKKPERAKKALLYSMAISFSIDLVMGYLSFFHGDLLSKIFSSDPTVVAASAEYLKAYAIDCLMTAFMFCLIGYFNGLGKTRFVMIQGILSAFLVRMPVAYFMSRVQPVSLFLIGLAAPAATFGALLLCIIYLIYLKKHKRRLSMPSVQT